MDKMVELGKIGILARQFISGLSFDLFFFLFVNEYLKYDQSKINSFVMNSRVRIILKITILTNNE